MWAYLGRVVLCHSLKFKPFPSKGEKRVIILLFIIKVINSALNSNKTNKVFISFVYFNKINVHILKRILIVMPKVWLFVYRFAHI